MLTIRDIEKKTHIDPRDLQSYVREELLDLNDVQADEEKALKALKMIDELA